MSLEANQLRVIRETLPDPINSDVVRISNNDDSVTYFNIKSSGNTTIGDSAGVDIFIGRESKGNLLIQGDSTGLTGANLVVKSDSNGSITVLKSGDLGPRMRVNSIDNSIEFFSGDGTMSEVCSIGRLIDGNLAIKANVDGYQNTLGNLDIYVRNLIVENSIDTPSQSIDHHQLANLVSDDHLQYFRTDGGRVATGDFNLGGFKITGAANATSNTDVITKQQLDNDVRLVGYNTRHVRINPGPGEYSNPLLAIQDPIFDNPNDLHVIRVHAGIYDFPTPLTMKANVVIVGDGKETVVFRATGNNDVIIGVNNSGVKHVTIKGSTDIGKSCILINTPVKFDIDSVKFDSGYYGINIEDPGNTVDIESLHLDFEGSFETCIRNKVTTESSRMHISSSSSKVSASNFIHVDGALAYISISNSIMEGENIGKCVLVSNGAHFENRSSDIHNWEVGTEVDTTGSYPELIETGTIYEECTMYINVLNSTCLGYSDGSVDVTKIYINPDSSFFIANKDLYIITVGKRGCDFTNIQDAINFINPTQLTGYQIEVGPGIYSYSPITMKKYIRLTGSGENVTIITPLNPSDNIIVAAPATIIEFVTFAGAYAGGTAIYNPGDPSLNRACMVRRCNFTSCTYGIKTISNSSNISNTAVVESYCIDVTGMDTMFYTESVEPSPLPCYLIVSNFLMRDIVSVKNTNMFVFKGSSVKSTITSTQGIINAPVGTNTSKFISVEAGAQVNLLSCVSDGYGTTLYNPNIGTGPDIRGAALVSLNSIMDVDILNPLTTGYLSAGLDSSKIYVHPDSDFRLSFFTVDEANEYGQIIIGDIGTGPTIGKTYNFTKMLRDTMTHGMTSGNLITSTGLTVGVVGGDGFLEDPIDENPKEIRWANTSVTCPDNSTNYIFYNSNGNLTTSNSRPEFLNNIILGRSITYGGNVVIIEDTGFRSHHQSQAVHDFLAKIIKTSFLSGSITTEGSTVFTLNVTNGKYFYAEREFSTVGGTPITFSTYYKTPTGWVYTPNVTTVDNLYYNDITTGLSLITGSHRTQHQLWIKGNVSGTDTQYFLVYGQEQINNGNPQDFADLQVPPHFDESITPVAKITLGPNDSSISAITDARRIWRPSTTITTGGGGVTDHGDLTGLLDDDHPQYLLTTGSRVMTGGLDLGTNTISNVSTVNGVTVQSHSSRHAPNGADPLPIGNAVAISEFVSFEGINNTYSRSDHIHPHGSLGGGNLHALATISSDGFMSSEDKTLLSNAGLPNGLAVLDSLGNISISQIPVGLPIGFGLTAGNLTGTSLAVARSDHTHNIPTGVPVNIVIGGSNLEGAASTAARSDHVHTISSGIPIGLNVGIVGNSEGVASTVARSDHTHSINISSWVASSQTNASVSSGEIVVMTGMITTGLTPALTAGRYLVNFSAGAFTSTTNTTFSFSIYVDGVQVASSIRSIRPGVANRDVGISTQAVVNYVTGPIEIRWSRVSGGGTATVTGRSMDVVKLS